MNPRKLNLQILIGLAVGTGGGVILDASFPHSRALELAVKYVAEPAGQIFLRALLMVVVPLVFTTLVVGIAGLGDVRRLGRLGVRTLALFLSTTILAAGLGLLVVRIVRPGTLITPETRDQLVATFAPEAASTIEAAGRGLGVETFVNIVPRNPVAAAANGDLIAVIFFTIVFGIAVLQLPERYRRPLVETFEAAAQAIMGMINLGMRIAPYGIGALAFAVTARLGLDILGPLLLYAAAVLGGLVVYQFGVFGLMLRYIARVPPLEFFKRVRLPMLTAFSTASSSATLPTTMRTAEDELGVKREISGFVLPLGATLHMNGTAFYEAITIMFLAQSFGITLTPGTQALVVIFTALTAVGAAGVPAGAIPLVVVLLEAVGIPGESIALIFGVEPILEMARTSTNVTGDLFASLAISRSEGIPTALSLDASTPAGAGD